MRGSSLCETIPTEAGYGPSSKHRECGQQMVAIRRAFATLALSAPSLDRDGERMVDQQAIRREKSQTFFLGLNG